MDLPSEGTDDVLHSSGPLALARAMLWPIRAVADPRFDVIKREIEIFAGHERVAFRVDDPVLAGVVHVWLSAKP